LDLQASERRAFRGILNGLAQDAEEAAARRLLAVRHDNAHRERRFYGASADKDIVKEPVYDVKVLDRFGRPVPREVRLLDQAAAQSGEGEEPSWRIRARGRCACELSGRGLASNRRVAWSA
jgi:hypothetical protein